MLKSTRDYLSQKESLIFSAIESLKEIHANELNYHLIMLLSVIGNSHAIDKQDLKKQCLLVEEINVFIKDLKRLSQSTSPEQLNATLNSLNNSLEQIVSIAEISTAWKKIKNSLINICSIFAGMVTGALGAVFGFTYGICNLNTWKGFYLGFVTGVAIGGAMGVRAPQKFFSDDFARKLSFTLSCTKKVCTHLCEQGDKLLMSEHGQKSAYNPYAEARFNYYQNETKRYVIETYLLGDLNKKYLSAENIVSLEQRFKEFLQSSEQKFQVCTTTAAFLDNSLKGYIGHHALIRFHINDVQELPIEFGRSEKTPAIVDQQEEPRVVSGQKLFDMLVLNRQLKETHRVTAKFMIKDYMAGQNDCFSYVNKVLLGTGQEPAKVTRFKPDTAKWSGAKVLKSMFNFFGPIKEHELDKLGNSFATNNDKKPALSLTAS